MQQKKELPQKTIFLVEDNPAHQEMVQRAVERCTDAYLEKIFSAEEALKKLDDGEIPDLIILDLNLGQMTGAELIRRVKGNIKTKDIDIVVLTTSSDADEKQYVIDLGASGCYTKTSNPEEFDETLHIICEFWLN